MNTTDAIDRLVRDRLDRLGIAPCDCGAYARLAQSIRGGLRSHEEGATRTAGRARMAAQGTDSKGRARAAVEVGRRGGLRRKANLRVIEGEGGVADAEQIAARRA